MAKKKKEPRNEDEIVRDLNAVLSSDVSLAGKKAFINYTLWAWSERHGKYTTRWRSNEAWAAHNSGQAVPLRHDHAIPRNLLVKKLLHERPLDLKDFLARSCFGVTITKDDDSKLSRNGLRSKMPADWNGSDWQARYKHERVSIVVREREAGDREDA